MADILKIAELLGEENAQKLKDSITELLLDTIKNDLDSMCNYLIDFEYLFDEVRDAVFANVKDKMVKKYTSEIERKFDEIFQNRKENP